MKTSRLLFLNVLILSLLLLFCASKSKAQSNSVLEMGQAAQVNVTNNIIPGGQQFPIGQPACDVGHFDTVCIQINPTGTVSGGTIQFQGSNDDVNFLPVFFFDLANITNAPVSSITPATSTPRIMAGPLAFRYFRASITSPITGGGSVQSWTTFATTPFSSTQSFSTDPSGNLNTTIISPLGQNPAASSVSVALANEDVQDLYVVGAAAQTATVNNILTTASGTASTDATGYRSASVQVVSTGTGGTFIFEGSNDNVNFAIIPFINQNNNALNVAAITASASTTIYSFPVSSRYIRLRIASTITGGSLQAFTSLKQTTWATPFAYTNINAVGQISVPATGSGVTAHPLPVGGGVLSTLPAAGLANTTFENLAMTGDQQLIVHQDGDPTNEWQAASGLSAFTSTASTTLKAAAGTGIRNYVTGIQIVNTSTTATTVTILDGAVVIWAMSLPATSTTLPAIPITFEFRTPLKGTAATAMNIQQSGAANLWYNVQGFQNN